jgi:hypothetical protein
MGWNYYIRKTNQSISNSDFLFWIPSAFKVPHRVQNDVIFFPPSFFLSFVFFCYLCKIILYYFYLLYVTTLITKNHTYVIDYIIWFTTQSQLSLWRLSDILIGKPATHIGQQLGFNNESFQFCTSTIVSHLYLRIFHFKFVILLLFELTSLFY